MISTAKHETDNFVSVRIPTTVLKELLSRKALYLEDLHCTDSASKHLLKKVLMMSVTPNLKT